MQVTCNGCSANLDVKASAEFCPKCGHHLFRHVAKPTVELTGVCKSFRDVPILNGLSLSVPAGESVVIVGMSGSGKSVLMEHIIGFQHPDSGTVHLFGENMSQSSSKTKSIRRNIGMVFQGSALIDSLSVRRNVMLPLTSKGVPLSEASPKADTMLRNVGMEPSVGDLSPAQLSGGMQKRVGIARALIATPDLILYDEPTTGLDAATSTTISQLMREVQVTNPDLTSITITHDYLSAGIIADRVLYLDQSTGQLQEVLSVERIAAIREHYAEKGQAAVDHIRRELESFFAAGDLAERSGKSTTAKQTWLEAFGSIFGRVFNLLGASLMVLAQTGWKLDGSAIPKRLYQIGYQSILVTALTGMFVGMMLSLQIGLGLDDAGVVDPLPRIVGLTILEKIGPLVAGLLLAGRLGASISAEIGGKQLSRQFDALRAMAVAPEQYWLVPIMVASLICFPLLTLTLEFSSLFGAYFVAFVRYNVNSSFFWGNIFEDVQISKFLFGLVRSMIFGLAVVLIAYSRGAEPKRSSDEIGQSTTVAVTSASVAVIILDFVLVFIVIGT